MQFVLGIHAAPGSPGAIAAYRFITALLKKHHKISQIFFYEAGVAHADNPSDFQTFNIPLRVCSTLKPHPSQKNILPQGLVQYIDAILKADRHVIFG